MAGREAATSAPARAPGQGEAKQEIVLARLIRARGVVAGMSHAQIAEAIHDACGPVAATTWIRAYRLALGVSLADVAAQLRAWYEAEGRPAPRFSETLLSAYESGQKRPGPEYLHYLCAVYRADPPDLGYPDHCFCGRSHRTLSAAAPEAVKGQSLAAEAAPFPPSHGTEPAGWALGMDGAGSLLAPDPRGAAEDDDDVLRRAMLRLIAASTAAVEGDFFSAVDRIRRRMDEALVSGTVSASMLDHWEETTAGYGRQYMTVPPLRLLCDVLLDFGDVRRMAEQRQPLESAERLCRLAGQLAGLAGMVMIDVGDQRTARAFFRTARTGADETGDRHLRAWVAVREGLVPLYYGDPGEACALARAGGGLAGRNPCAAAVMAPVLEARAISRVAGRRDDTGRRQALRRASALLGQAHELLGRLPEGERGDTAFGYTQRQLLFHEGDALVSLGHHRGAEKAFARALEEYAPEEVLDRSLATFGLARCRLEEQEPEEALRLSQETLLAVPPEHRSEIVVRTARSIGDSVADRHRGLRAVHEYREALLSA